MSSFTKQQISSLLLLCLLAPITTLARIHNSVVADKALPQSQANARRVFAVHISPLMDLYYLVRKHASAKDTKPVAIVGFDEAVDAARQLDQAFGGPMSGAWGLLDLQLTGCSNSAEALEAFSRLPEAVRGGKIPVREGAVRLGRAMSVIEQPFLKTMWPQRKAILEKNLAHVNEVLEPKAETSLAFIAKHLRLGEIPPSPFEFYLVTDAPDPGSITYFLLGGRRISVVGLSANGDAALFTAMLFEATHVLRYITTKGNVLTELAELSQKAGIKEDTSQNMLNTLIFVQGAETVQRITSPSSSKASKSQSAGTRFPHTTIVMPIWTRYLDGKLSSEEALAQIVDGFRKVNQ